MNIGEIEKIKKQVEKMSIDEITKQLEERRKAKLKKVYDKCEQDELNGVYIYARYCEWIRRYRQGRGCKDTEVFKRYLKEESITLTDRQRLFIATKYFNWREKCE